MNLNDKIYIAGHRGLVGSAIERCLRKHGFHNLIMRTHGELDLCDAAATDQFIADEKPDCVILSAARVGGIVANDTYPVEFFEENMRIGLNVITSSFKHGVKKLCYMGTGCIYPRDCPQPIREEYLLTGPLEKTNEMYALAKISLLRLCAAYNREYGTSYFGVMPCNLYGLNDSFRTPGAHVLPMLVRRFHEARMSGAKTVSVWGTGKARREFMCSDDLAEALLLLLNKEDEVVPADGLNYFNIGTGSDLSIAELAALIKKAVGFEGEIIYDPSKPDGTPQKLFDVSRIHAAGWRHRIELEEGIGLVYRDFLSNPELRK
ncbi:MAG: GDP-L-fucose synthase [Succinivibrio sp.]|nr:GDP-L-fucose synthase [Succinivibrio sp.]